MLSITHCNCISIEGSLTLITNSVSPFGFDILDEDVEVLVAPLQLLLGGVPERQGALELLQQDHGGRCGQIHNGEVA